LVYLHYNFVTPSQHTTRSFRFFYWARCSSFGSLCISAETYAACVHTFVRGQQVSFPSQNETSAVTSARVYALPAAGRPINWCRFLGKRGPPCNSPLPAVFVKMQYKNTQCAVARSPPSSEEEREVTVPAFLHSLPLGTRFGVRYLFAIR